MTGVGSLWPGSLTPASVLNEPGCIRKRVLGRNGGTLSSPAAARLALRAASLRISRRTSYLDQEVCQPVTTVAFTPTVPVKSMPVPP
jgi:hypothetical protein